MNLTNFFQKNTVWKKLFFVSFFLFLYWPLTNILEGDHISALWTFGVGTMLYAGSYSLLRLDGKIQMFCGVAIVSATVLTMFMLFSLGLGTATEINYIESAPYIFSSIFMFIASSLRFIQKWGLKTLLLILLIAWFSIRVLSYVKSKSMFYLGL